MKFRKVKALKDQPDALCRYVGTGGQKRWISYQIQHLETGVFLASCPTAVERFKTLDEAKAWVREVDAA